MFLDRSICEKEKFISCLTLIFPTLTVIIRKFSKANSKLWVVDQTTNISLCNLSLVSLKSVFLSRIVCVWERVWVSVWACDLMSGCIPWCGCAFIVCRCICGDVDVEAYKSSCGGVCGCDWKILCESVGVHAQLRNSIKTSLGLEIESPTTGTRRNRALLFSDSILNIDIYKNFDGCDFDILDTGIHWESDWPKNSQSVQLRGLPDHLVWKMEKVFLQPHQKPFSSTGWGFVSSIISHTIVFLMEIFFIRQQMCS